jgi:cytochrome oxidase Cu insertion factor (SCO1/SenC/PrrC family)
MKVAIASALSIALLALASGQAKPPADDGALPAIGLAIGQPAPAFSWRDQFGHEQSSSTLKGSKGTVLLFFRSADW